MIPKTPDFESEAVKMWESYSDPIDPQDLTIAAISQAISLKRIADALDYFVEVVKKDEADG